MNPAVDCNTILVVDDDEDIRLAMSDTLEAEGYRVTLAADGKEALELLRGPAPKPCLILLDLMMPIMDGWGFCAAQKQDPTLVSIPVIIVSADAHVKRKADEIGVAGSMSKPVKIVDLLEVIERHCRPSAPS